MKGDSQMTTFSDRLKEAMYAQNLKQIDLVHIAAENNVKLGKSHVSQYVSGKTVPRNDILHFLADTLHVDADWLLGDSQENFTARENNSVAPKAPSTTKTSGSVGTSNSSKRGTTPMKKTITDKNDNDNAGSSAMHIFKKSSKLDNVLYDVRGPVVEEAARMEERGTHVLKLNIGNPAPFGFRTPDEVIYDMSQQLSDCEGYSPSQGLFSARKAIMQYSQIKKLPNVTISDIYTGNGVSELINLCMSALLDNGDEILIPSPDYPLWTACATLAGGKAVHYICDEQSDWYPDIEDMRRKITDRTKALVIINPNNPTGEVRDKKYLTELIAKHPRVCFVIDQSYEYFTLKELFTAQEAAGFPNVILLHSMTKRYAIPGLRLGYVTAHPGLIGRLRTNRMPWSVNQLAIEAGLYLLSEGIPAGLSMKDYLAECARLKSSLEAIGGLEVWPTDTHFMLVCLRFGKAAALKEYLAREEGILIRDASNFEGLDERFFRIATQTPEENDELVGAIAKWMAE